MEPSPLTTSDVPTSRIMHSALVLCAVLLLLTLGCTPAVQQSSDLPTATAASPSSTLRVCGERIESSKGYRLDEDGIVRRAAVESHYRWEAPRDGLAIGYRMVVVPCCRPYGIEIRPRKGVETCAFETDAN